MADESVMSESAPFQVTAPASAYFRSMMGALSQVPEASRLVLQRDVGGSPLAWPLALVLAGWRRQRSSKLPSAFVDSGADKLVEQIGRFKSAFPPTFTKFLDSADRGEEAAAGSYFKSTLADLADFVRSGLNSFLTSDQFLAAAQKIVVAYGRAPSQRSATPRPAKELKINTPQPPDKGALLAGHLTAKGWSPEDIARIMAGPDKAHLTAEGLYRQVAANKPQDQAAFQASLKVGGGDSPNNGAEVQFDETHLQPSKQRLMGSDQLKEAFDQLPEDQQARFRALLQKRPVANSDGKGTKPSKETSTSDTTALVLGSVKGGIDLATSLVNKLLGGSKSAGKTTKKTPAGGSASGKETGKGKGKGESSDTESSDTESDTESSDTESSDTESDTESSDTESDTESDTDLDTSETDTDSSTIDIPEVDTFEYPDGID